MTDIAVLSCVLGLAWLPIALRFYRRWKSRKNPISLAVFAGCLLFAYTNVLFALTLMNRTTWQFFTIALHGFNGVVVLNFYISFYWSDKVRDATAVSQSPISPARRDDHDSVAE
jgi:hypothetical protein